MQFEAEEARNILNSRLFCKPNIRWLSIFKEYKISFACVNLTKNKMLREKEREKRTHVLRLFLFQSKQHRFALKPRNNPEKDMRSKTGETDLK